MPWDFGDGDTLVLLAPMPAARLKEHAAEWFKKKRQEMPESVAFERGGLTAMLLRSPDERGFLKRLSAEVSPIYSAWGYFDSDPFNARAWAEGKEASASPPPDIFDLAEELGCPIPDRPPSAVVTEAPSRGVDPGFEAAWLFQAEGDLLDLVRRAVNAALGYTCGRPRRVTLVRGAGEYHAIVQTQSDLGDGLAGVLNAIGKGEVFLVRPSEYDHPAYSPGRPGAWRFDKKGERRAIDEDPFVFAESLGVCISAGRPRDWPSPGVRHLREGDGAAYGGYSWVVFAPLSGEELFEWTRRYRRKHVNPEREDWIIIPGSSHSAVLDPGGGTMMCGEEEFCKSLSLEVDGPVYLAYIDEHTLDYGDGGVEQWMLGHRRTLKKEYPFSLAARLGVKLPGE